MRMEVIRSIGTNFDQAAYQLKRHFEAWQAENPRVDFHSFNTHWFNYQNGHAGGRLTFFYDSPKETPAFTAILVPELDTASGVEVTELDTGPCTSS